MIEQQTLLIVDDSESDLFLLRRAFTRAEFNPKVQELCNGDQAVAYLSGEGPFSDRNKFPLPIMVLLDLNMPMKNGLEVLKWLRAQPSLKRLTVIMMTASMRVSDVEMAFDLGVNSFLVKPTGLDELVGMVRFLRDWILLNQFPPIVQMLLKTDL